MTSDPRAFLALDLGTASSSAALIGRLDGRWRLLGSTAIPATTPLEPAIARLLATVRDADPALAGGLRLADGGDPRDAVGSEVGSGDGGLSRLVARTHPTPRIAVLAAASRHLGSLEGAAARAGWRTSAMSADAADPIGLTALVLDRAVEAVLVGSGDPPAAEERPRLDALVQLVLAAAGRRPELDVVLAGAVADRADSFRREGGMASDGALLLGPAAGPAGPAGEPLRALLEDLRARPDDGRLGIARATASLSAVLDRRLETIEIGMEAGLRCVARPSGGGGGGPHAGWAVVAAASLFPPDPDDAIVDGIIDWSTVARDRLRLRDRIVDLRRAPWADADGDGALLRLAAARAAVGRLLAATPDLEPSGAPDLVVASGGAWSVAPGPVVSLALADVVRRPGVSQYALDHARLLGPLGTIEDEDERRLMLADLADDLLVPLGSVVLPGGVRASHEGGHLAVHAGALSSSLDLVPGGLQLVDLPPGEVATAELRFRDPVVLGTRGRRFEVEVSGGLGGLLVDLRDIPLRFPERSERRRELLAAWQRALWTGLEG